MSYTAEGERKLTEALIKSQREDIWKLRAENEMLRHNTDALRAENGQLRALLEPFHHDTDAQTDPAYPKTTNDVLHLLSCYMADFLPDNVVVGDEYFAAWERQARPVIERLIGDRDERLKLVAFWEWSREVDKLQFEADMKKAEFPFGLPGR